MARASGDPNAVALAESARRRRSAESVLNRRRAIERASRDASRSCSRSAADMVSRGAGRVTRFALSLDAGGCDPFGGRPAACPPRSEADTISVTPATTNRENHSRENWLGMARRGEELKGTGETNALGTRNTFRRKTDRGRRESRRNRPRKKRPPLRLAIGHLTRP